MDPLPLSSLPIARQMTSLSPNPGHPVVLTPFLFWHYFLLVCDPSDFLETQNWFFTCTFLRRAYTGREGRWRYRAGGAASGFTSIRSITAVCSWETQCASYKHRTCFFVKINAQRQENGAKKVMMESLDMLNAFLDGGCSSILNSRWKRGHRCSRQRGHRRFRKPWQSNWAGQSSSVHSLLPPLGGPMYKVSHAFN